MSKRKRNIMLRLNDAEFALLTAAKPAGEEDAAFARRVLLEAVGNGRPALTDVVAFIVGVLSPDISPPEAADLFAEYMADPAGRDGHDRD